MPRAGAALLLAAVLVTFAAPSCAEVTDYGLSSEAAVAALTQAAPDLVEHLRAATVPREMQGRDLVEGMTDIKKKQEAVLTRKKKYRKAKVRCCRRTGCWRRVVGAARWVLPTPCRHLHAQLVLLTHHSATSPNPSADADRFLLPRRPCHECSAQAGRHCQAVQRCQLDRLPSKCFEICWGVLDI